MSASPIDLQVKLSRCEVEDTLRGCIAFSQLLSLLPLLHRSLQLAKLGTPHTLPHHLVPALSAASPLSEGSRQVEATWILALALKALLTLLEVCTPLLTLGAHAQRGLQ